MQEHGPSQTQSEQGDRAKPPYGPVSPVGEILEHYRSHDLPAGFDRALLRRLDIASNNESKVLNTLSWLGFTDESGQPTTVFRRLQASDADEFERVLAERIRAAYHEIFNQMDPTKASYDEIFRFFARQYSMSLGHSMARLFVGLCQSAGMRMAEVRRTTPAPVRKPPATNRTQPQRQQLIETVGEATEESGPASAGEPEGEARHDLFNLYVHRLIDGLPPLTIDAAMEPDRLRLMAELRSVELDRIERLLQDVS
jgi:hypothetical protein